MNQFNGLVDFHCHVDLYPNFEELIKDCEKLQLMTLAVTTTPRAWPRNRDLMKGNRFVLPALGLHPQTIGKNSDSELALWESYLPEADFIGEVGLDSGPNFVHNLDEQKRVFRRIVECSTKVGGKLLSVHSVRSAGALINIIEEFPHSSNRYVLHWFSGSLSELKRAVALDCYFSVNMSMLRTNKGRGIIRSIPPMRLITETDGPFTSSGNRPSTPHDVLILINELAKFNNESDESMTFKIKKNLERLLTR